MTSDPQQPARPLPRGVRGVLVAVAVAAAAHTMVVAWWILPDNLVSEQVSGRWLNAYVEPFFEQSWSVFAPIPKRGTIDLEVRGRDGDDWTSPWVSLTAPERDQIRYSLAPSRSALLTQTLAGSLNGAYGGLSDDQRDVVTQHDTARTLRKALLAADGEPAAARRYLRTDGVLEQLASVAAQTLWDGKATQVELRTVRRQVVEYGTAKDGRRTVSFRPVRYGWRNVVPVPQPDRGVLQDHLARVGVRP